MNRVAKSNGFTLIELMLAMAFISVLLLAIALTIIQIGTTYNKGMTLKEVNQAARSISDELRRGISGSESFNLATSYYTNDAGGRLCLGQYSYVWNWGKALSANASDVAKFDHPDMGAPVHFLKVPDAGRIYCARNPEDGTMLYKNIRVEDASPSANKTTELLKAGDRTLTIHQFSVGPADDTAVKDSATGQRLYTIHFTIGTGRVSALTEDQTACLPPGNVDAEFAFCTVQQFTLAVRAGNRVN